MYADKTKDELIARLETLRKRNSRLESLVEKYKADAAQTREGKHRELEVTRTILDKMPIGIIIVDKKKKIKSINRTVLNMMELDSEKDILGKTCHLFICPRDVGNCPILDLGQEINQCETNLICNGGKEIPVLKTVIPITLDNEEVLLEAVMDITERKKQEQQLKKLSRAIEQSPTSIVITDTDGKIEYVNPAFTKVTGYSFDEAAGQNPRILKPKEKKPEEYKELWDTLLDKKVWQGDFQNVKKNGDYYWESAAIGPVLNEKNEITHYVAVKEDITLRKKAEEALRKSEQSLREANATKDKLFSILAHDLKNAFNVILAGTSLLSEGIHKFKKEKIVFFAKKLSDSAENTNELLDNLLTWSRLQMGRIESKPGDIKLNNIIQFTLKLFYQQAKEKDITFNLSITKDVCVFADYEMVNTVVRNLINNAIKFTKPGGAVDIVVSAANENFVETCVLDTGTGIEPEHLPELFNLDSKFRRKGTAGERGTGLGLPLCREFIEKNGGKIWVESEPERGSIFKFTLPKPGSDGDQ